MELVPIIYTILKIVAALTILALAFSYISFKIRHSEKQNAGLKKERINSLAKPIPENVSRAAVPKSVIEGKAKQNNPPNQSVAERAKISHKKVPAEKPPAKVPGIKKPWLRKERLEVLKNLSNKTELHPEEKRENQSSRSTKEKLNSLGDDILDKYLDEDKNNMFTLNVKEKKNKS